MAVDMFLKLEGIDGESDDSAHANEIDVLSWSWGMSQSATMHMGKGGGSGKCSIQDLTITKYVDASTPNLIKFCCKGEHIGEATLVVRKAAGDQPLEYIKLTMNQVVVASISTGGSGSEDRITESVTLNFGKFGYEYVPQDDEGIGQASIPASWDIARNCEE